MTKLIKTMIGVIAFTVAIGFTFVTCGDIVSVASGHGPSDPSDPLEGTVSITGTAQVGQTLTANTTSLSVSGTIFYQWRRDGMDITGANSSTYTVTANDIGHTITVTVISSGNSGSVTSAPTAEILPPPTPPSWWEVNIIADPSIKLFMDGSFLENGGTTTFDKADETFEIFIPPITGSGTQSNPLQLFPGNWVNSSIPSTSGDTSAWYSFPVISGTTYYVWWDNNQGSGNKTLDTYVIVLDGDGSWITGGQSAWDSPRQFTANQTGNVIISVRPENTGGIGTFGIVYNSDNSARPALNNIEHTDITWYVNGNIVACGASRRSITLSKQIPGVYQITVEAVCADGIKNSAGYNIVIQ